MKRLLLTTAFAVFATGAFAAGPGLSDSDIGQQKGGNGATVNNYSDHPNGVLVQSGANAQSGVTNSGNVTGSSRNSNRVQSSNQNTNRNANNNKAVGGKATATGNSVSVVNDYGNGTGSGAGGVTGNGFGPGSWGAQSAVAPNLYGSNPCSGTQNSGAVQGGGFFGLSFGHSDFDVSCQLNQAKGNPIAMAYLCRKHEEVRQAAADIGEPCPQDRPKPVPAPMGVRANAYDYCYTRSPGDLNQHRECHN